MTTIYWKAAAPFGTSRSRYKARRAAAVAARLRDKRLIRKIGDLLGQEASSTLSLTMRSTFAIGSDCPHCGLSGPGNHKTCSFCASAAHPLPDR